MAMKCDKCEIEFPHDYNSIKREVPDNGLYVKLIGGYGLFNDPLDENDLSLVLCHDCCVEFFRTIPKFKKLKGLHVSHRYDERQPFCCEYSWSWDEEENAILGEECDYYRLEEITYY